MAQPTSKQELIDYCLRRLGFPVIDINVDEDQLSDRVDDALQKYAEFHYDGTTAEYLAHKITAENVANKYIDVSSSIIGINRILPLSTSTVNSTTTGNFNMFDLTYQLRLNELYDFTSSSYTYYVMAKQHIEMLHLILIGDKPVRFNKKNNRVFIDLNWNATVKVDDYIILDCARVVDPASFTQIFNDSWLKDYVTASFKEQWGTNLTKYGNYVLPGGITINGDQILSQAQAEKAALLEQLRDTYEEPSMFLTG